MKSICREIIKRALEENVSREDFQNLKSRVCREFDIATIPKNADILECVEKEEKEKLLPILLKKPTRSISGVSVIAVMPEPRECPGECIYCPKGEDAPQSYTGEEPAALRARRNKYDPVKQVKNRIEQLRAIGHPTDKAELIIMGGTFPAQPKEYQANFVKGCFDAMIGRECASFDESIKAAETSEVRPIGVTVETRPDFCGKEEIEEMMKLGVTRVELGVQTVFDEIYEKVNRGHTVEDVVKATKLLKDAGIKVGYHIMPGLPGSSKEKDLEVFKTIFADERFKPDMLKIYPTLVMEGTELYDMWKTGKYEPLGSEEAAELIARAKKDFPRWVRVMRVTRDIPANLIAAGVKKSNLRQLVKGEMRKNKWECKCIRCREAGHRHMEGDELPENIEIHMEEYKASDGREFFISAEDFSKDILVGYVRLRISENALVRELHVYGSEVSLGEDAKEREFQHKGWGRKLLQKAERIAVAEGKKELLVRSGVGVREYYRGLGYSDKGAYMGKVL